MLNFDEEEEKFSETTMSEEARFFIGGSEKIGRAR